MISVLILTHSEELHLARAMESDKDMIGEIFVVDSYSSDRLQK